MMSLDERIIKIVELLVSYGRTVTSQEIANIIGISSRTVRETIHQNKSHLKLIGIEIKSHFKSGYSISIEDEYRNNWKTLLDENRSIIPSETEDKITHNFLVSHLPEGFRPKDNTLIPVWVGKGEKDNTKMMGNIIVYADGGIWFYIGDGLTARSFATQCGFYI